MTGRRCGLGSIQRDPVTFIHFISAARNRERQRERERKRATREYQRPLQLRNGEQFCGPGAKREGGGVQGCFGWQENEMCWKICKSVV